MEWIIILPIFFFTFVLLKNINNQLKLLFNVVILGIWLYVAAHYFVNLGKYDNISALLFNHITPIYLLVGPSFYFFVIMRLGIIKKMNRIHFIHFIPAVVHLVSIYPYFFIPWEDKINIVQKIYSDPVIQENLKINLFFNAKFNYGFRMIHFVIYCFASLNIIHKSFKLNIYHKKSLLKSLQKITIIFLLLTFVYSIHIAVILVSNSYTSNIVQIIIFIDVGLLFILGYELINYPELYFNPEKFKLSYLETSPFLNVEKNNKRIPDGIYYDIDQKIKLLKKERTVLVNPNTNFDAFSKHINQSKFHIRSYLILNNTSFIKLKNETRVEEAIKYLESQTFYKLDYIAKMSGFNTRSNFFKIFKQVKKLTPSQYQKKILEQTLRLKGKVLKDSTTP